MKKLKLLFAACALLLTAGVQAQSWTGSEVGEGYALLYNVGTGKYLTRGNGWNTQASIGGEGAAMTVCLEAHDGKYKIRTQQSFGLECLSGGTVYTDQSRNKTSTWTFEEIDATNHVYNIISADNHGDGSGKYLTAEGGESTIVGPGNDGTNNNAQWKIYLHEDRPASLLTAMSKATTEAPVDVTCFIKDANFGSFSDIAFQCWTVTATNRNLNGGKLTNPCAETYMNGGGKFSQTIKVPNGTYKIKCQGFYDPRNGGNTPSTLFANDETVGLKKFNANGEGTVASMDGASDAFTDGHYENEIQVTVTGKSLTIGIEGNDGNWTCFDNFRLMYLGPLDLSKIIAAYQAALNKATGIDQNSIMSNSVLTALSNAITTYSDVDDTDQEALSSATIALNEATDNATTSIANYIEAKAILEAAKGYDKAGQASYAADETIAAIQNAYDSRTLEAVTDEQKAAAQTALVTACKAQIEIADNSDMTVCIVNPNFDSNANGWTTEKTGSGWSAEPYNGNNHNIEYWSPSVIDENVSTRFFDYYQTITGLPNGAYTISATMLNSTNNEENEEGHSGVDWNGGGNAGVYGKTANDEQIALITINDQTFRTYTTGEILVVDGELRIGVKNINPLTGRWFAADNFKLTYVRQLNEKETAQILYNAAFEAAKAIEEGSIPSTAYSNLQTVITNNTLTDGTSSEYNAATTALSEATAAAQLLMDPYAAWKALKAQADALVAVSTNNTKENAGLASDIDTQNTAAEAATTVDAIGNATTTLKTAMVTYATTAEPTNEECFDITFMIENPHFTEGEGGWGKVASGWTLESGSITEHRLLTHNFEAYHTQFNLSQTISGLQKGTYKVTLQGFARHDNNGPTDKTNLYCGIVDQKIKDINDEYSENPLTSGKPAMGDNNGEAGANGVYRPNGMSGSYYYFQEINPKTNQPFYTNEVQTLITEAGDLKIGFKCETGTDWVIWDNFHLYYYGSAIAVELDEATGSSYTEDIDNANVTLKKTIFEGWNTITIPFAASAADFKGTELYKYTGDDETTLKFEPANSIEPNVPYLIKATEATNGAGTFTFKGITVKAATDLTTEGSNYNFLGTYQEATVADGDYILGEDAFYRSNGGNKVKAYRAYIQKKSGGENARLTIFIDGKATAIDTIDGEAIGNADIYNLAGQKVKNAQKGVYIQNGKKFVVK